MLTRRQALIPPLLALCWGLNWPAVKIMLTVIPPFLMRGIGLGAGALLLLGAAVLTGRGALPPRVAWPGVALGGVLNVAVFNVCTAIAQLNTSTSRAAVLTFTMPMISALLAWALLGERLERRSVVALLLGSAGIALLAWPALTAARHGPGKAWLGLAMPLTAALAWALGSIAIKRRPLAGDPMVTTAWQLLLGGACGLALSALAGEPWPAALPLRVELALVFHIAIATAVAYVLWFVLLARVSVTVSALTTLMVPVVGVLGAMALVGDRPGLADWLGFALVLGGAGMVVLRVGRTR